jgi:hypothetical protein
MTSATEVIWTSPIRSSTSTAMILACPDGEQPKQPAQRRVNNA